MFARERLDVVHVNTPPTVRAEVIRAAAEAGVKALIIEKPIGLEAEDYLDLRALSRDCPVRVAVNHQLHFHPNRMALQKRVADGQIGQVRLIDASARLNLATQGTHMLQAISAFNPAGRATSVFAAASGANGLAPSARAHYAPDDALAQITYDNAVRATLRCGPSAPAVDPTLKPSLNKRISVYGDKGQAHWTMWGWEIQTSGGAVESGRHDYFEQDPRAQAAMTEAMFDWLGDAGNTHPLCLDNALDELEILLGLYTSVIRKSVVGLPLQNPEPGLIDNLRKCLTQPV
jgi:predicted dehydrogenase